MSDHDPLCQALRNLPVPDGYFSGLEGPFRTPPHNVLTFARRTSEEAMDGGLHLHPRFVFGWCAETAGSITVDGRILSLSPGHGLLLFPFQQHYFSSFQTPDILWAFVTFDLEEYSFLEPLRSTVVEVGDEAHQQLERITHAFITGDGSVTAWLELLLSKLVRQVGSGAREELSVAPDQRIQKIVQLVYAHLDRSLSIDDLAEAVHVSPGHLRRLFRSRMGISLGRFMLQARLNHARSLLHTTDFSVGHIAEASGFSSVYAFSRAFRNEIGGSPSTVRRRGE